MSRKIIPAALRPILANTILVLVSILIPVGLAELALRVAGFKFHLYPEEVRFVHTGSEGENFAFSPDPELLWTGRGYSMAIDYYAENPPKIAFVGDSCTAIGNYPEFFAGMYVDRNPGKRTTFGRVATVSWSSYQGLQALKRDVARFKPEVATFYFGWNDHWKGFGIADRDAATANLIQRLGVGNLRVFQFLSRLYLQLTAPEREPGAPTLRVPPEHFRENLQEIVRTSREMDIVPMLFTAPTTHRKGEEPEYLKGPWLDDLSQLIPLHQQYANIVRQVAQETGAPLCDLEQKFAALPRKIQVEEYFWEDGIHFYHSGNEVLAGFVYDCFEQHDLLERVGFPSEFAKQ